MVKVTLINGSEIVLNCDLIEFIEAAPDTIISLTNGKKMIVKEPVDDVVARIVEFKRRVGLSCNRASGDTSDNR